MRSYAGKAEIALLCTDDAPEGLHCGACNAGKQLSPRETVLAENAVGAGAGDFVKVTMREHGELKAALTLFIVPLLSFLMALVAAHAASMSLWISFLSGAGALALTLFLLRIILKKKTYYLIAGIK
ncbi:SoxR reducing system RseC family protein [Chlorobium sp.]|uniref:SoxR reducing system RseC family protein n=1 Tax=Chlorobium sp. TaxID=1095 RepID=UPI0025C0087E|nr:SoxR reducing system RseC family protein [Chlorobium sp.]